MLRHIRKCIDIKYVKNALNYLDMEGVVPKMTKISVHAKQKFKKKLIRALPW